MSITLVRKSQIRPLNIIRSDINTTTSGSALITKIIAGTGLKAEEKLRSGSALPVFWRTTIPRVPSGRTKDYADSSRMNW